MLRVTGLPPLSSPPLVQKKSSIINPISPCVLPINTPLIVGRTGLCLFAQKKHQSLILGSNKVVNELDFEEEEEFEIDDEEEENGDFEEDDDIIVPFLEMDDWLKRKPKGFGEGMVYDTSIEDKLLEEIELSRKAQIDNVNKLKNELKEANLKNEVKEEVKVSEDVQPGTRVRISNLPKKRNIHRNLKLAFEGVKGIVNISPVVSANKKTRDPVCKGFGFVDFRSLEDGNRFIQMFSSQKISFGKVEKQIKCEILRPNDAGHEGLVQKNGHKSIIDSREDEDDQDPDTERSSGSSLQSRGYDDYDESSEELDNEDAMSDLESELEEVGISVTEPNTKLTNDSGISTHEHKAKAVKKKAAAKKKHDKTPKLNIPGSAKRLKMREKAKLADVFSRYGSKEALASK